MDMEGLHSFITVVREKSISKAAQALHITQPTLSTRLRKLEESLGVTLLDRSWDGIKPTRQGRFFLSYSVQLLQELEEAATLMRRQGTGGSDGPIEAVTSANRLHVGIESFIYTAFLEPVIQGIREVSPELECRFVSKPSELLYNLEEHDGLHISVNFNYQEAPRLVNLPVIEDRVVLLTPLAGYPLIRPDLGNVEKLKDRPFILFESSPLLRYREVTEQIFLRMFDSVPESFHIVADVHAMIAILAAGFGYTFTTLSSIVHLIGKPLPFNVLLMDTDYIPAIGIQVSYSPTAAEVVRHPLERLAHRIRDTILQSCEGVFAEFATA